MSSEVTLLPEEANLTPEVLISQIVRQTMVLVGQLATSAGLRASLSTVADQVFLDLVDVLESQRVPKKVAAEIFGMALRGYQAKISRLSQSETRRGFTLWQAVLEMLQERRDSVPITEIVDQFAEDDERLVRAIIHDLVERGHAMRSGTGDRTVVRVTSDETEHSPFNGSGEERLARLALHATYHYGPLTAAEVATRLRLDEASVADTLDRLVVDGLVHCWEEDGQEPRYRSPSLTLDYGDQMGWEAAIADHYQSVVAAIAAKLTSGALEADRGDVVGGSTYHFDVWKGHPLYERAQALLGETRKAVSDLRKEIAEYNETRPTPERYERITFYCGQYSRTEST